MKLCFEQDLMEINNEFQNLKKRNMSVSKYVAAFVEKMKLVPYLVLTELSKVNKFASRLPTYFSPTMKLTTTLNETIWAARNVETQIRERDL